MAESAYRDFTDPGPVPSNGLHMTTGRALMDREKAYRNDNYTCFCGVFHVKRGAMIVATLELLRSAVIVALAIWLQEDVDSKATGQSAVSTFLFVANLIISFLICVTASALIYGLRAGNRRWMTVHMFAQPCAFVYLFVLAVYLLVKAGKGRDQTDWTLGFLAAVAAGIELWFAVVVFRAYKYLRDIEMDARERLMTRAYFAAVKQLLQLPMAPDVNATTQEYMDRIQKENVDVWMGQELQVPM